MTNVTPQKRIASKLVKRGVNGIWVDPEITYKVANA